jgi:hypothetical protein
MFQIIEHPKYVLGDLRDSILVVKLLLFDILLIYIQSDSDLYLRGLDSFERGHFYIENRH